MDTVNFLGISIVGQSNRYGDGDCGIYVGSIMKGMQTYPLSETWTEELNLFFDVKKVSPTCPKSLFSHSDNVQPFFQPK